MSDANELLDTFSQPDVMESSPWLQNYRKKALATPESAALGVDIPRESKENLMAPSGERMFHGDYDVNRYAKDAGDFYEQKVGKEGRDQFEEAVRQKTRKHILGELAKQSSRPLSWYTSRIPGPLGDLPLGEESSLDRFRLGRASGGDYWTAASHAYEKERESGRPWFQRLFETAQKFPKAAVDYSPGGLPGTIGAHMAQAPNDQEALKAAGSDALTGLIFAGAGKLGSGLFGAAAPEASETLKQAVGQYLKNWGKGIGVTTAAMQANDEAQKWSGLGGKEAKGGLITRKLLNGDDQAVQDFIDQGGAVAIMEAITHARNKLTARGEAVDPKAVVEGAVNHAITEMAKSGKETPSEATPSVAPESPRPAPTNGLVQPPPENLSLRGKRILTPPNQINEAAQAPPATEPPPVGASFSDQDVRDIHQQLMGLKKPAKKSREQMLAELTSKPGMLDILKAFEEGMTHDATASPNAPAQAHDVQQAPGGSEAAISPPDTPSNGQRRPPGSPEIPPEAQEAQAPQAEAAQAAQPSPEAPQPGVQAEPVHGAERPPDNGLVPAPQGAGAPSAGEPAAPATPEVPAGGAGVLEGPGAQGNLFSPYADLRSNQRNLPGVEKGPLPEEKPAVRPFKELTGQEDLPFAKSEKRGSLTGMTEKELTSHRRSEGAKAAQGELNDIIEHAKSNGWDVNELHERAAEWKDKLKDEHEQLSAADKAFDFARERLGQSVVNKIRRNEKGFEDPARVTGLDDIAKEIANSRQYAGVLDPENASEDLMNLIRAGKSEPPTTRHAYERALEDMKELHSFSKEEADAIKAEIQRSKGRPESAQELISRSERAAKEEVDREQEEAAQGKVPLNSTGEYPASWDEPVEAKSEAPVQKPGESEADFEKRFHAWQDEQGEVYNPGAHAGPMAKMLKGKAGEGFAEPVGQEELGRSLPGGGQHNAGESVIPPKTTALANVVAAKEREANRLPPLEQAARQSNAKSWDLAMQELAKDPEAGVKLVEDLKNKMRPTTVVENALLDQRKVTLSNQYERAIIDELNAVRKKAPNIDELAAKSDALKAQIDELDRIVKPTGTETARSLQFRAALVANDYSLVGIIRRAEAAKKAPLTMDEKLEYHRLTDLVKDLQSKLEEALASKQPAKPGQVKGQEEMAAFAEAKQNIDQKINEYKFKQSPATQKATNIVVDALRSFKLWGPRGMVKVGASTVTGMVAGPAREAAGSALRLIPGVRGVMEKASSQGGGFDPKVEYEAKRAALTDGWQDFKDKIVTGDSQLDILAKDLGVRPSEEQYGSRQGGKVRTIIDLPGRIHGAMKAILMREAFTRSLEQSKRFNEKNGIPQTEFQDIQDLKTALQDGYHEIFQEDNAAAKLWSRAQAGSTALLEKGGVNKSIAGLPEAASKVLVPFPKTPTNIIKQALFEYFGGLPIGGVRVAIAKATGKLTTNQANSISRQLKNGVIGGAGVLLGFYLTKKKVGELYQRGLKKEEDADIPDATMHHSLMQGIQMGATIQDNMQTAMKKGEAPPGAIESAIYTMMDSASEQPHIRAVGDLKEMLSPKEGRYARGQFAKSLVVPAGVDWAARQGDTRNGQLIKRKPSTILQHIETGIPGLRQKVPEKR